MKFCDKFFDKFSDKFGEMLKMNSMLKILPKSLWVTTCNSGSCNGCDIEVVATISPRYDIERFGMKLVGTPRHADVLIVTGPVTRFMRDKLLRVYNQMPDPKVVVVVGNCGASGDVFYKSYNLVGPVDNVIPVDVYVHGCPPRPEAIIEGVAKAVLKIEALEKSNSAPAEPREEAV
ncbi:NiFe-hydrogenase small subunit [Synergistales bacterium]|nr:NiFe-hydrogenase small subunit [Synergistales bacterium]